MPAKAQSSHRPRKNRTARAKHERLREHFINEFLSGRLKSGEALPTETELVSQFQMGRTTIRQAMASLESEGFIRRMQGKGTFVESDVRRKLKHGQDVFALVVLQTREGFYPSLLHGFETAATDSHYQSIVCSTGNDVGRQADIFFQLLDREVGGIALNPTSEPCTPAYQVQQLQKQGIPVVFLHRRVEGVAAPLLEIPFHEVGRQAGMLLAEQGHSKVAFLDALWTTSSSFMEQGLKETLLSKLPDAQLQRGITGNSSALHEENVLAALKKLFSGPDRPTAIFATFDSLAEMIYVLLPQLGLRVPEDVSLVGFGGAWREGVLSRRLTSVVVDEIATGRRAVSVLHEMRNGDRAIDNNEEIVLGVSVSQGQTLSANSQHKLTTAIHREGRD